MGVVNSKRVFVGALLGWVAWVMWSSIVHMVVLAGPYAEAQEAKLLLADGRYPFFLPVYFLALLAISYILAWIYAGIRDTYGANPATAAKLGLLAGFAIAFPANFATAAWSPLNRIFPLWWLLELWIGAFLATFIAAWLYREG